MDIVKYLIEHVILFSYYYFFIFDVKIDFYIITIHFM